MKFSIRKNEEGGGASSKLKPQSSPASTVASSGSKFSFSSPLKDSKVNKSTTSGKGNAMSAGSLAQRSKGDAFVQEADATLKKSTWLASSTKKKNGRAVESLTKAADAYKAGGCNDEAGKAYQRAAELHKDKLKNTSEASKCLSDAGECLKKSNPTESTRCYQSAVSLLCDAGKLDQANLRAAETKKSPGGMSTGKKSATSVPTNSGVKKSVSKNKTGAEGNWKKPSSVGGGGKKKTKKKAGLLGSFVKK